jgi:hypothetical protein
VGLIRSLDVLKPEFRRRLEDYLSRAAAAGYRLYVFETGRTDGVQAAYCLQGRAPLAEVNAARAREGLYFLNAAGNASKITEDPPAGLRTVYKERGHGNGTAADIVLMSDKGNLLWPPRAPDAWLELGRIAEECGLVWGGRWPPIDPKTGLGVDPPHVQLPRGIPI